MSGNPVQCVQSGSYREGQASDGGERKIQNQVVLSTELLTLSSGLWAFVVLIRCRLGKTPQEQS